MNVSKDVIQKLEEQLKGLSVDIKDGKRSTSVTGSQNEHERGKKLHQALAGLQHNFSHDEDPPGEFTIESLSHIAYDPTSDYAQQNPNHTKTDTWWSRLEYDYDVDGESIRGDVLPIFGSYLDLYPRTGKKSMDYAKRYVSVYLNNDVVQRLANAITRGTKHPIAEGKEIVDDIQGLSSFQARMDLGGDKTPVRLYRQILGDDGGIKRYDVHNTNVLDAYRNAVSAPNYSIVGGIAFVRVTATYSCAPNQISSSANVPDDTMVDMKFKLVAFHCFGGYTDAINQITYRKKDAFGGF